MAKATSGNNAQFTYDFGISIAQSTVNKVARLAGVSLTLASAFYALRSASEEYVDNLHKNQQFFGGMIGTMKAMEQATNRLAKGKTFFGMSDQLAGMRELMKVGVQVGNNMEWIDKSAHAMGKSYTEFSGAIASAIEGNMGQLIDMGLITQRASLMFEKYSANTVMRQQAILNFVKQHKGLQSAIANDFVTIQDHIVRIKEMWKGFLYSIIGKPNDPSSLYGQVVSAIGKIANAMGKYFNDIKRVGQGVGIILGWVVKQAGKFVMWLGGLVKKALSHIWGSTDAFVEWCRSLVVWLEFWKIKIVAFFKEYKTQIKWAAIAILSFMALKKAFIITSSAIDSIKTYVGWLARARKLQKAYLAFQGPIKGRYMQSLAAYMPRGLRKVWVALGKKIGIFFASGFMGHIGGMFKGVGGLLAAPFTVVKNLMTGLFGVMTNLLHGKFLLALKSFVGIFLNIFAGLFKNLRGIFGSVFSLLGGGFKGIGKAIIKLPKIIGVAFKAIRGMWTALNATNPIGWIILAVTAIVILYKKCKTFRTFVNGMFQMWINWVKLLWNAVMVGYAAVRYGLQVFFAWIEEKWNMLKGFFAQAGNFMGDIWGKFMNTKVGKWLDDNIIKRITKLCELIKEWFSKPIQWFKGGLKSITDFFADGANGLKTTADSLAEKGGFSVPTLEAATYKSDSTDYLSPKNWGIGGSKDEQVLPTASTTTTNPMNIGAGLGDMGAGGGTSTTNLSFNSGAIQIVVQKGENIDENKLANKIMQVIKEHEREGAVRGGKI